ncbi:MAG: aminotransferase class III-fold pyridoxal phosphate-dependent enzyme [Holophagales bacterium]|jgi:glutamate-1-semialdehyde aminotransferase|nr:aminotransferase class III-fold pyridoxal phosphate-dependent enzyme [Holophagales bacterium]
MPQSAAKLNLTKSMKMYEESQRLSPGGMMGIRRPYNFIPGEYPVFLERGYAGHIVDVDGNDYIDMLCAYGPIIMGYDESEINDAVQAQMKKGFCFSLVQPIQNELEQKLIDIIPCAEKVILVKTGSDATSVAVRIARGYTDKNTILRCGYHGWHDWAVEVHGGVPQCVQDLTVEFEYGDLHDLEAKIKAHENDLAGIIVTPVGHPLAKPIMAPPAGYLQAVRALADKYGAVLIFDEIRTGFRVAIGGAQEHYGITPDLSTFGKAMANGYPISAVVGKSRFMDVCEKKVFISSTFFPNSLEMAAALKCIEILQRDKIINIVWEKGKTFLKALEDIVKTTNAPAQISGIPPMPYLTFNKVDDFYKERRERFYTETIRRGLFIQPYHHWYISARHTEADLERAIKVIHEALEIIMSEYPIK